MKKSLRKGIITFPLAGEGRQMPEISVAVNRGILEDLIEVIASREELPKGAVTILPSAETIEGKCFYQFCSRETPSFCDNTEITLSHGKRKLKIYFHNGCYDGAFIEKY
ncbi:MAG: hypothetical protein Q8Q42_03080 [Nanoarchaeota archaeon]|nr:hypothetical protein [Nanoarchaeota archaeon]